jgi:NADH-quinone oxidoreductase subunit L
MNQYYVPVFYVEFIVKPYRAISDKFWALDKAVVDGTVDLIAKVIYKTGDGSRSMQNGNLSTYLNWMGAGALLLVLASAVAVVIG